MITGIIILSLIVLTLGFVTINLLNKLERYEDFVGSELIKNEALLSALREIDNREMFEKDDEVGSVFYQIKDTIEKYKQFN
jgi:hypothetical protein